jgi:hypothetical protein
MPHFLLPKYENLTRRREGAKCETEKEMFKPKQFLLVSPLSNHVNPVILSNMHVRQPRDFRQDYMTCMIGIGDAKPVPNGAKLRGYCHLNRNPNLNLLVEKGLRLRLGL